MTRPAHLVSALILCVFATATLADDSSTVAVPNVEKTVPKAAHQSTPLGKLGKERVAASKIKKVNLNAASAEELMKVQGITEDIANVIIAKRPFNSKANLVTENILPMGLYVQIKNQIEAGLPPKKGASVTAEKAAPGK